MRSLALAQAWKDSGGGVIFITDCENVGLLQRLSSEGFQIVTLGRSYPDSADWEATSQVLAAHPNAWVVLDGYHFDPTYQRRIKGAGHQLLVIDDMAHLEHYYADIVLNQNLHAEQLNYSCESYTRLLLGARYVSLRSEFLVWRGWQREIPKVGHKVLIALGGGDPDNQTLKVIRALQEVNVNGLEAVVVVGASNPHFRELESAIRNLQFTIRLIQNVTNMPELMAWADVAVSAGGSTCWEMAFMGLPSVVLILANNQRPIAEQLNQVGAAMNLGWYEDTSSAEIAKALTRLLTAVAARAGMAQRGQQLVDGEGVTRVLMHIKGKTLRLRRVCEDDCSLLWEWANDPDVRAVSFSAEPIPWEHHVQWFKSKLNDPNCFFYVALDSEGVPVGQVRYDIDGNQTVIAVSIDQKFCGKGYGSAAIWLASQELFGASNIDMIHAYVKRGNEASARAFMKAGFRDMGITTVREHQAIHLALRRDQL